MESIQQIYKSHVAAAALTLSASLPFAGAAHADIKYFEQDINSATAQHVAQQFEQQGKNVAVLHRGKPMGNIAENYFLGTLEWLAEHKPHLNIAVVGGGDHKGVVGYFGSDKKNYSEASIIELWMMDDIERRLENKAAVQQPSPQ
ncbi:MAG: hypothetical protein ACPGMR_02790 [Pontibacterium sp.]